MKIAHSVAAFAPLAPHTYFYKILPVYGLTKLVTTSSDDSLRLIDAPSLQLDSNGLLDHIHAGITALKTFGEHGALTAGREGKVKCTDFRTKRITWELSKGIGSPFLSLACSENLIAAGTELTNHQASTIVWDSRATRHHLLEYIESHNDDVTSLSFHPSSPSFLLSGSTDGLVNLYDITIADEDDALIQVFNHGSSIAQADFLSDDEVFALSHDEVFSIYETRDYLTGDEHDYTHAFGDLRPQLQCEYIADLVSSGLSGPVLGAGSHSIQHLDIVPLQHQPSWILNRSNAIRLPGAHGEEIVRSLCLNGDGSTIFTAGEDGLIKAWRASGEDDSNTHTRDPVSSDKKRKKHEGLDKDERARFKPY